MKKLTSFAVFLFAISFSVINCTDYDFDNPFDSRNLSGGIIYGSLTDSRDDQNYRTVTIGTQIWMAENLNYATSSGSWCYDNQTSNCDVFGRLYDWNTALTVCPDSWHLPSDAEWTTLIDFVGSKEISGTRLKTSMVWTRSNVHSNIPVGTNEFGFSALPGGVRYDDDNFHSIGDSGNWWTTTEGDVIVASTGDTVTYGGFSSMSSNYEGVVMSLRSKTDGLSVRCVKSD